MTDAPDAIRPRSPARCKTDPPLADAAARLLDRLRAEPLPEDAPAAAALRKATRNAFLLVEEARKLTEAEAPFSPVSRSAPRKNSGVVRPFFTVSDEPAETREDRRENRADLDLEAFHKRVDRAVAIARKHA